MRMKWAGRWHAAAAVVLSRFSGWAASTVTLIRMCHYPMTSCYKRHAHPTVAHPITLPSYCHCTSTPLGEEDTDTRPGETAEWDWRWQDRVAILYSRLLYHNNLVHIYSSISNVLDTSPPPFGITQWSVNAITIPKSTVLMYTLTDLTNLSLKNLDTQIWY